MTINLDDIDFECFKLVDVLDSNDIIVYYDNGEIPYDLSMSVVKILSELGIIGCRQWTIISHEAIMGSTRIRISDKMIIVHCFYVPLLFTN